MAYTSDNIVSPGQPPVLWSDIDSAFRIINQNFVELYATIGGGSVVNFSNLSTNVSPSTSEFYDLGSSTKRWRDLWLSGSSIHLGNAVITATGETVNLPVGSTIGGLRVDENYFKYISVDGQDNIEADDGTDTLNIAEGDGIFLTTDATTDTLTITNAGVLSTTAGTGIGISGDGRGDITITNQGVTRVNAGLGISLDRNDAVVEISSTAITGLNPGIGISVSDRDPITGRVNIVNTQPNVPQQTFNVIAVPTQSSIAADSTADTLTIQTSGDGLSITTAPLTDTLTFTNTGVTSLAVGNGLTINAGTGSISLTLDATLSRNIVGDITGSVFADDSTRLIDATEGLIVGDVNNSLITTESLYLKNTNYRLETGEDGNLYVWATSTDGDVIIRTNSSGLGQNNFIFGKDGNLTLPTGTTITPENKTSGLPGDFTIRGQQTSGTSLSEGGNLYIDGGEGNVGEGFANGGLWLGTDSALIRIGNDGGGIVELHGYARLLPGSELDFQGGSTLTNLSSITTDLIGSVFADDSTKLVDAVEGLIVGNVDTGRLRTSEVSIALGNSAGATNQGASSVAIGPSAGVTDQGANSVAIGALAGTTNQGVGTTAVGSGAGNTGQGVFSTAVGYGAGTTNQGGSAVAIGNGAGGNNQGQYAVALGHNTASVNQGERSVAIGYNAGNGGAFAGSIIINAEATTLASAAAGLYVAPIRNVDGGAFLNYNTTTKEIGYSNDLRSDGNINIDINLADSTLRRWQFGEDGIFNTAGSVKLPANRSVYFGDAGYIDSDNTSAIDIYANGTTDVIIQTGEGSNSWIFKDSGYFRHPGELASNDDTTIVTGKDGTPQTWTFGEDGTLTLPGALYVGTIDTSDSSDITVVPGVTFNADVTVENELFIGTSRVMPIAELKSIVAASTDFADFQARIAAL